MATEYRCLGIYRANEIHEQSVFVSEDGRIISEADFDSSSIKEVVVLDGYLYPAFRDGHAHPLFAGEEAVGLDISNCLTEAELIARIRDHVITRPELTWIDAAVFDRSLNMNYHRYTLDLAEARIPVVLHGDDHHTIWVNTKALEVAGLLDTHLPDLPSGTIDVDEAGVPTGLLREWPAMSLVLDLAPQKTTEERVTALLWADQKLAAAGLVECVDAWIDRGMAEIYLAAWKTSKLKLDYVLAFRADQRTFEADLDYFRQLRQELKATRGQIQASSVKFFVDGVFGSASALVSEPYLSTGENGEAIWPKAELAKAIQSANSDGFQIHLHAIGDEAIRLSLDILEGLQDLIIPPVIAHAELVDREILDRMLTLGAIACVQPYWAQNNGLVSSCLKHLGPVRLENLYSFRDMSDVGVTTVFSSDWPISTYKPLQGISVAVNRREHDSQAPHNPSQAISIQQALANYSQSLPVMLSRNSTGTLAIGQPFDAVLLDNNLFAIEREQLAQSTVLATFKSGKEIFRTSL